MGLTITARDAVQLAQGIWEFEMPPHQIRFFGDCRRAEGSRSILLLSGAKYDAVSRSLVFEADDAIPLNIGATGRALAVSADGGKPKFSKTEPEQYGPGDREFLALASELPPTGYETAQLLLKAIRAKSPGDLSRGLQRNFSNTPDNFWYVIVQPRIGGLSITVRGEPERYGKSKFVLKPDRPGYTRFQIINPSDVDEAIRIIFTSKRRD